MTYTIFIEYRIDSQYKQDYLRNIENIQSRLQVLSIQEYELLEATDQENLFVERVRMNSLEHYVNWKKMIKEDDPSFPWSSIFPYIIGGKDKFNMWSFCPR